MCSQVSEQRTTYVLKVLSSSQGRYTSHAASKHPFVESPGVVSSKLSWLCLTRRQKVLLASKRGTIAVVQTHGSRRSTYQNETQYDDPTTPRHRSTAHIRLVFVCRPSDRYLQHPGPRARPRPLRFVTPSTALPNTDPLAPLIWGSRTIQISLGRVGSGEATAITVMQLALPSGIPASKPQITFPAFCVRAGPPAFRITGLQRRF